MDAAKVTKSSVERSELIGIGELCRPIRARCPGRDLDVLVSLSPLQQRLEELSSRIEQVQTSLLSRR